MRVNVIGTYNALEAALATLGTLERYVDFSTSEVFGTHAMNVEEGQVSTIGSVGEARWTYAVSKLAGEHMALAYHDELGLPTVTVHPFNIFGPGQIGGGAIRAFIEAALADRDLTIHGDGSQIRAWTYVTDMVAGVLACLEHPTRSARRSTSGTLAARHGLRPRAAHQAPERRIGRDRVPAAALRRRRAADPERAEGPRGARLGAARRAGRRPREDDRVVQREDARIRLGWPDVGAAELDEVAGVLESGMLTMGPKVPEFEAELARACEVEHALAVSSGTAALHLAVLALGLEPGDEVIVPAYTFPATANVVALAGLRPVLVDVDPETMNIDPEQIEVGPTDEGRPRSAPVRPAGAASRSCPSRCRCSRMRPARSALATEGERAAVSACSAA